MQERENKYLAHNGSFKWRAINYVCQTTSVILYLWMLFISKDLLRGLWISTAAPTAHWFFQKWINHIWFNCKCKCWNADGQICKINNRAYIRRKKVKNVSYCTLRQLFKCNWINRTIKGCHNTHISNLIPALGKIFSTIINTCKKQKRQNRCEEYQSLHGSIAMLISCAFGGLPPCFCCRSNRAVKVGCCIFCLAAGRLFSASICYIKRNTAPQSFFIKVGVPVLKLLRWVCCATVWVLSW